MHSSTLKMQVSIRRSGLWLLPWAIVLVMGIAANADNLASERETLRARVEALAVEPRIAGTAVADHWFLLRFYQRHEFTPAWSDSTKLARLTAALELAAKHGLDPSDYHMDALRNALTNPDGVCCAELDILATDALARLAFHLHFGKVDPAALEPKWNFARNMTGVSPINALTRLLQADDLSAALEALAPQTSDYRLLIAALAAHREAAAAGGWPTVPDGAILRAGASDARVTALRRRLAWPGDVETATASELFDTTVETAVRHFQRRHGLDVDGVVGPRTLAALNVPVEARIDQLRVNLERTRWLFRDVPERHIEVNIARFKVSLIDDGKTVWETRAVVGRPYRQTPSFRAEMRYVVLNPTWTVPPTILRQDVLPEMQRDPGTLERRNMQVLDFEGRPVDPDTIDWANTLRQGFPYMIRQKPGPDNALGTIKLMYPNPYHIYMHDTPQRELFGKTERSFSSGCVRLEQPMALAALLLADTEWDDEALAAAVAEGETRTINLPKPIPVLTLYGTVVADDGEVIFLPDIYQRDQRVLEALNAPFRFAPPAGYEDSLLG
jgi:murein L,D-transpeptidase YcbB/YkuD